MELYKTAAGRHVRVTRGFIRAELGCDGCGRVWKIGNTAAEISANKHAGGCRRVPGGPAGAGPWRRVLASVLGR